MSYSVEAAMKRRSGAHNRPWLQDGQPSEAHGIISKEYWTQATPTQRKSAAWRWYQLQVRRTDLTASQKTALWAIIDTWNSRTGASELTQMGVADMVGISRSTAARVMRELIERNVIWSYIQGMPQKGPDEMQAFILEHIGKPERRQRTRYHIPVGLSAVLRNSFAD